MDRLASTALRVRAWCLSLTAALAVGGCQIPGPRPGMPHEARAARTVHDHGLDDTLQTIRNARFMVEDGGPSQPLAARIRATAADRAIIVGERHDHYEDHLVQLAVLDARLAGGAPVTIGVEWFQSDVQQALDDYVSGRIDERTLLRRSDYFRRWGFDYRLYRPVLRYARRHGIPVVALNAPPARVETVSRNGFIALPESVRRRAARVSDLAPDYVQRLRDVFEQHPAAGDFERFVAVQLLWDETMAGNAAEYLRTHPDRSLVLFMGVGHAAAAHAVPERLAQRIGRPPLVVTPTTDREDAGPATDLRVPVEPLALPDPGRLGIRMGDAVNGVAIQSVTPGSAAAAADLRGGDRILAVDGTATDSPADVRLALYEKSPADTVEVQYRRPSEGKARTVPITLR